MLSPRRPHPTSLRGVLVDRFGWPAVFWINVPVVAVKVGVVVLDVVALAFVLAARFVPESSPARWRVTRR